MLEEGVAQGQQGVGEEGAVASPIEVNLLFMKNLDGYMADINCSHIMYFLNSFLLLLFLRFLYTRKKECEKCIQELFKFHSDKLQIGRAHV